MVIRKWGRLLASGYVDLPRYLALQSIVHIARFTVVLACIKSPSFIASPRRRVNTQPCWDLIDFLEYLSPLRWDDAVAYMVRSSMS